MDIEKLIEQYREAADKWEKRHPVTDTFDLRVQDALRDAATALSTLQAENEKLRAELEQVRRERDAAQSLLAERIGVRGAEPITTAFGLPIDRLRELVEMDSAGCIPPCKIGDVFYRVYYGFDSSEIEKYRVSMVTQKADRSWRIRATDTESSFQIDWSLDDFSKRAYKTREEAEAALAKLNSET